MNSTPSMVMDAMVWNAACRPYIAENSDQLENPVGMI